MRSEATDQSDRLYTEYITTQLGQLRRLASVLCQDSHRADDLVQEAITKLYTRWHKRHGIDHLDRYLRSILVREFLDSQRVGWMRRVRLAAEAPETASPQAASVEDRLVVQALLAQMPPRQRAVVVLRFMCDLPVDEVAEILGCSEGTVKSQTSIGLITLRRHVRELSEDASAGTNLAVRS